MPSISVITPTYNKAHFLDLTLASYLHQTHKEFELVLVDDGSTDNTAAVVDRYRGLLNIKYIHQPNRGRATARNTALREATGDIVVFADDDRLAAPAFLAQHAREFSSPGDNTIVLGAQEGFLSCWEPHQGTDNPWLDHLLQTRPEFASLHAQNQKVQLVSASDIRERFPEMLQKFRLDDGFWVQFQELLAQLSGDLNSFHLRWVFGTTGNMSVPRQRVVDVGMFDESFSGWGLEDSELCYRLCQAGARFVVNPAAINYHQFHARSPAWRQEWFRNFTHLWAKYDVVQLPLLFFLYNRLVTPQQINAIVDECERLEREGRTVLVQELKRVYRMAVMGFVQAAQR